MPARDTIMGTMYTAVGLLGTQAKLIDFLWTIDYGENVIVKALGVDTVSGKTCDHFSVRRLRTLRNVWLDRGTAVPCKLISRSSGNNDRSAKRTSFSGSRARLSTRTTFSSVPRPVRAKSRLPIWSDHTFAPPEMQHAITTVIGGKWPKIIGTAEPKDNHAPTRD